MTGEVGSSLDELAQDQSCIQYWTKMDFPEDFSDDHCSTRAQTVFCLVAVSGTIDLDDDLSRRYFSNFGHPQSIVHDVVLSTASVCRRNPCTSERSTKDKMRVEASHWITFQ
jgi:hypothetical protein